MHFVPTVDATASITQAVDRMLGADRRGLVQMTELDFARVVKEQFGVDFVPA